MVIKLYISGISGNKEVKKKQQRVQMILDSKQIDYEAIDITEPGKEKDKEFMQQNGKVRESLGKYPLPPQIFNDDDFCGDYEDFDMANEVDELEKFLHIATNSKEVESTVNGLQEQIIDSNKPSEENGQAEGEVSKSEVNGETETVVASEPSSKKNDDVNDDVNDETTAEEVPKPLKEEEPTETEGEAVEKNPDQEKEEEVGDDEENEVKTKEEESKGEDQDEHVDEAKEEKEEEVENAETLPELDVEKPSEDESPQPEAKEEDSGENLDSQNKENESEKEEESEEGDSEN